MRLRNSLAAELLLVVAIYGLGFQFRDYIAVDASTWAAGPAAGSGSGFANLSLAGWWNALVSVPLFQFLLLRWYFRLFIWARFLWQVSRFDLKLLPAHPDGVGGLGFLDHCRQRVRSAAPRARGSARGHDRRSHLLCRSNAPAILGGDYRDSQRTRVRGARPAHGVCGTARTRQAHGPRRVRRACAALRQRVRHEVGPGRPRPGTNRSWAVPTSSRLPTWPTFSA